MATPAGKDDLLTLEKLQANNGAHLGTSKWFEVRQDHMNMFGECTQDIDPQHMDPEWARSSPFGQTIAFGFWTVSMLAGMSHDIGYYQRLVREYEGVYPLNYGLDNVRLISPVPVGSWIRMHMEQLDVRRSGEGRVILTTRAEVEIRDQEKPALVADWLFMLVNVD